MNRLVCCVVVLILTCFITVFRSRKQSSRELLPSALQAEFSKLLAPESIPVGNFPDKVYRCFLNHDLAFLGRSQFCGGNVELHHLTRRYRGLWNACGNRDFDEILRKLRIPVGNSFMHVTSTVVGRSLTSVFNLEFDDHHSGFVFASLRSNRVDVCSQLLYCGVLHGLDSSSGSIGARFRHGYGFYHPVCLNTHSAELSQANEYQSTRQVNDPPVRRRFILGLFGCVGGYGLIFLSLRLRDRFFRRCFVGLGCLGVLVGLLGWWITF